MPHSILKHGTPAPVAPLSFAAVASRATSSPPAAPVAPAPSISPATTTADTSLTYNPADILTAKQLERFNSNLTDDLGELVSAVVLTKINAHHRAVAAKQVGERICKDTAKRGNTDLSQDQLVARCAVEVARCNDRIANQIASDANDAASRAAEHATREATARAALAEAQRQLNTVLEENATAKASWEARAADKLTGLRVQLEAAEAAHVAAVSPPPPASMTPAVTATIATTAAQQSPPPPSIRPLLVPPTLTLHADADTKARLLHARTVIDHYHQQDVVYPLHLQALRLSPNECATLVGDQAWTTEYGETTPSADQALPRGLIGVITAALRQLEVDLAAQEGAAQAAQATTLQLMSAHAAASTTYAPHPQPHTEPPPENSELKRRKTDTTATSMEGILVTSLETATAAAAIDEAAAIPVDPSPAEGASQHSS